VATPVVDDKHSPVNDNATRVGVDGTRGKWKKARALLAMRLFGMLDWMFTWL
jgi:hypothetical protein